jgi:hypothetical protein
MFRRPQAKSVFLAADFGSFKRQETIVVILNLFIFTSLLLVHTLLASYWGYPSAALIAILAAALFALGAELFWLAARSTPLGLNGMMVLTLASIGFNILLV